MNKKIIDSICVLSKLSEHELTEKLLEDKYKNKAILRELVRRCVKSIQGKDEYIKLLEEKIEW